MTYQANVNNVTYSLVDNGISLTPVEHGNAAGMQQRIETPLSNGEDYTTIFSVDGDNIVLPVTGGIDKIGEEINNIYLSYATNYGGYNTVRVVFTTNRPFVVNNARLIKGSYTPKTLPPWKAPSYSQELIDCMRYFQVIKMGSICGLITGVAGNMFVYAYDFPIKMRAAPTITPAPGSVEQFNVFPLGPYSGKYAFSDSTKTYARFVVGEFDSACVGYYAINDGSDTQLSADL